MSKAAAIIVCLFALTVSDTTRLDAAAIELRVAGQSATRAGDPPESVRVLALADARRKALEMFVPRLGERADITALNLTPAHLEAFILVLMEVVEQGADAPENGRIDITARVDEERAAAMIHSLRTDQDVTFELVEAGRRMRRFHDQLDEWAKNRAAAEGNEAARLLRSNCRSPPRSM